MSKKFNQGARDLAKVPTLIEIVETSICNYEKVEDDKPQTEESENGEEIEQKEIFKKKKLDVDQCSTEEVVSAQGIDKENQAEKKLKTFKSNDRDLNHSKTMKEDSLLLIRGFDSIACSLSHLRSTLDSALQGARDLAKAPTLTEIVQTSICNYEKVEDDKPQTEESEKGEEIEQKEIFKKRKLDVDQCSTEEIVSVQGIDKENQAEKKLKTVKSLAVSIAAKSVSLARELKSIKYDLCFMRDRCTLLEEENKRLRDGFGKEIRPDEDDLIRLQLEVLLAEKSRLAAENANLSRENQCLKQLVEYHQFATQDLSASYEQVIQGLCLDFSSPLAEEKQSFEDPGIPKTTGSFEFCVDLDASLANEQKKP